MEINKSIFGIALLITIFLLLTIIIISNNLDSQRENFINSEMQKIYNNFNEMQMFLLLSETYGDEMACLAFQNKLNDLDQTIWDLGNKIEQYRIASEEFQKNPYYKEQKQVFNENEVFYMMLLQKLKDTCEFDQSIIAFFYQNSADCKKCDDQSFVLTDINKEIDEEIAIFSFDIDLNLTTINLLVDFYDINEFPCVIIDENKYCGMLDKDFIQEKICEGSPNISIC